MGVVPTMQSTVFTEQTKKAVKKAPDDAAKIGQGANKLAGAALQTGQLAATGDLNERGADQAIFDAGDRGFAQGALTKEFVDKKALESIELYKKMDKVATPTIDVTIGDGGIKINGNGPDS
ncbi:hypothetical protein ACFLZ2_03775 [Candidatus Margulisiibacteriota bacterium]